MPSPTPPVRPVTPAPVAAPQPRDATSSTGSEATKRPASPASAQSSKRPRTDMQEGTADSLDEAAWHSRAWQIYTHGKPTPRPAPETYAWGYPVDD